jgi:DNA-directed RNA polymerase specialized sigma24 family protein
MPRALSGVAPAPDTGDLLLVAAGDDAAIQRLLERWRQPLYSLFERMREPSGAVDAAAEVLAELFRTADRYDPDVLFPVWIWGIAARHAQKAPAVPLPGISQQRIRDSASARTALLRSSVAALPGTERAAFLLTRVARLPMPMAARAMELTESELKKRLVRAMEGLTLSLRPILDAPDDGSDSVPAPSAGRAAESP